MYNGYDAAVPLDSLGFCPLSSLDLLGHCYVACWQGVVQWAGRGSLELLCTRDRLVDK